MHRLIAIGALLLGLLFCPDSSFADTIHRVKKGETLSEIASAYKVSVKAIMQANSLRNANQIRAGQKLTIPAEPPKFVEYKIRNGDSLSEIAKRYNTTLNELAAFNGIRNANRIRVGQVIHIPVEPDADVPETKPWDALADSTLRTLKSITPKTGRWKHIVIHHSGTKMGSAASMDRFHREERGMENGLAYHFVIGNGNGMGDGEVFIGNRWKQQIQGGHLASYALNQVSIGICLVGDFEKNRPTKRQMEQLRALVLYLMDVTDLPPSRVTTHTLIHPHHTACPGRRFPIDSFRKSIGG